VVLISNVGSLLLRLVSTLVLTRLLDASAFGIVGVMTSVAQIITLISNVGLFAFVVRSGNIDDPKFLDEVWTFKLARGLIQTGIIAMLSIPLSHMLGKPELAVPIAVAGLLLLGDAASSMAFATAAHKGSIQRLAVMDLTPLAFQIALSIGLAVWLGSVWAILIALLASAGLKIALSFAIFPSSRRHWRWSRARVVEIWEFGKSIAGSSAIQLALSQVDKLIFAKIFSLNQFGLYILATSLAEIPSSLTNNYTTRILFPIFARARNEGKQQQKKVYYSSGWTFRILYMLFVGCFTGVSETIVELLYDSRYISAFHYLKILSLVAVFRLPIMITNEFIVAIEKSNHYLKINICRVITLFAAMIPMYYKFGSIGLVISLVISEFFGQIYNWICLYNLKIVVIHKELILILTFIAGYCLGYFLNYLTMKIIYQYFSYLTN
jgi:O-antigen/teichoic acid export membrane protein